MHDRRIQKAMLPDELKNLDVGQPIGDFEKNQQSTNRPGISKMIFRVDCLHIIAGIVPYPVLG